MGNEGTMLDCMHPLYQEDEEFVQQIFSLVQAPVLGPALLSSLEARLIRNIGNSSLLLGPSS